MNKPTYLRMPTQYDAPIFETPSCAEVMVEMVTTAQRTGLMHLHAFVILPASLELLITPLQMDVMIIHDYLQNVTTPLIFLLSNVNAVWDHRFVVKWLDSQRALDNQLDLMRCATKDLPGMENPFEYPYSWLHPRYHQMTMPYAGFEAIAPRAAYAPLIQNISAD